MNTKTDNFEIAIEFSGASKRLPRGNDEEAWVLNRITGTIERGKIITLVGPSGSGKSTLLSMCNLLITPDEGSVFVGGKEIREWVTPQLRRHVGLVFQTPTMLSGTVRENISLGSKLVGRPIQNSEEWLRRVQLPANIIDHPASDLSGGQKQRVALARVLATDPKILLLDEVTSALDITSASEIEELLLQIHEEQNTTILWVTHNLEQAKRVGDETWFFVNGQLIEAESTDKFFTSPKQDLTIQFLNGELERGGVS